MKRKRRSNKNRNNSLPAIKIGAVLFFAMMFVGIFALHQKTDKSPLYNTFADHWSVPFFGVGAVMLGIGVISYLFYSWFRNK